MVNLLACDTVCFVTKQEIISRQQRCKKGQRLDVVADNPNGCEHEFVLEANFDGNACCNFVLFGRKNDGIIVTSCREPGRTTLKQT